MYIVYVGSMRVCRPMYTVPGKKEATVF